MVECKQLDFGGINGRSEVILATSDVHDKNYFLVSLFPFWDFFLFCHIFLFYEFLLVVRL